jgi:ADP-heptose:LPS heptosyltransferase
MIKRIKDETGAKIIVGCAKENHFVFKNQPFIDNITVFNTKSLKSIISNIRKLKKEHADVCIDTGQSSNISAIIANYVGKTSVGFKKTKKSLRDRIYSSSLTINPLIHMSENYISLLKVIGLKDVKNSRLIRIRLERNILNEASKKFKFLKGKQKIVGLHLWDVLPYKKIREEEKIKIIDYLVNKKKLVVITGSDKESVFVKNTIRKIKDKSKIIDLSGKINTEELVYVISKLNLFIALDGGPMHIAASMNTPVISIFGHDLPSKYKPLTRKSAIIYKNTHHEEYTKATGKRHPESFNSNCLDTIYAEDILKSMNGLKL